ncbi:MAG: 8-amino-7-oxononanoate synthase [Lentisphaeria bacterium]|jgi:8-amino-7-oxononanoate synthase|nr:8-amino-7-oxononanoate synthase [Lentisphaeria bacterium]MDP7741978.1 8-amino-7-oxononanoate synthase [Lentisphaeria bacterium]
MPIDKQLIEELEALRRRNLHRCLRTSQPLGDGYLQFDGKRLLNLASNDYLGLCEDLELPDDGDGAGATASRLIVGNHPGCDELEADVAELKGTGAALVFGSGYLANIGIIPALLGRHDAAFSDRLNHASIVDGIRLSGANHHRYAHNDLAHLDQLLSEHASHRRKLIVTDALFSMDGDVADLHRLVELKEQHDAVLMIDEAHSGGVFGARGAGLADAAGIADRVDVQMGTFSKAYGCYGAYAAGSATMIDYLVNHVRTVAYTTALPPVVVELIRQSLAKSAAEQWRRERLEENAAIVRQALREAGLDIGGSTTQIIPVIVGDAGRAVEVGNELQAGGIAAVAIRPPTVPEGTARIRLSVSAKHQRADLEQAVATIIRVVAK